MAKSKALVRTQIKLKKLQKEVKVTEKRIKTLTSKEEKAALAQKAAKAKKKNVSKKKSPTRRKVKPLKKT